MKSLAQRMADLGCPYTPDDERSSYWLEGYAHRVLNSQQLSRSVGRDSNRLTDIQE